LDLLLIILNLEPLEEEQEGLGFNTNSSKGKEDVTSTEVAEV
jgi:hypothetical protein